VTSWTNKLYGFAPTVSGQVSFIAALAQVVKNVPNHLGTGVFYWGAEYQLVSGVQEAGFNTTALFDANGNLLPAADAVAGMGAPLVIRPAIEGAKLQLQWPFSGAGSQLWASTNLGVAGPWSPIPDAISITGTVFTLTLPISNNSVFYRLRSP
jgi:hypothetical protein